MVGYFACELYLDSICFNPHPHRCKTPCTQLTVRKLIELIQLSYTIIFTNNANPNGTLVNSISSGSGGSNITIRLTDASNAPIAIGPLNLNNKFAFGTLNSSKSVSKALKASYYAETVPVTPGIVKSIATVNLIYD